MPNKLLTMTDKKSHTNINRKESDDEAFEQPPLTKPSVKIDNILKTKYALAQKTDIDSGEPTQQKKQQQKHNQCRMKKRCNIFMITSSTKWLEI
ncbi:hypothetical protein [Serratia odorifera]|uniref:Uncharacterized protein n=1 Tax=Serratia odorifera DSM 4582 TaxID=667129 RepID=D4E0Z4_SEROD|nr:hypothetical protein [Serratia odorifera]EFE96339.1 hypothetical protein HMPREF0758_1768 [Serratia odorifera DSM 4582]